MHSIYCFFVLGKDKSLLKRGPCKALFDSEEEELHGDVISHARVPSNSALDLGWCNFMLPTLEAL